MSVAERRGNNVNGCGCRYGYCGGCMVLAEWDKKYRSGGAGIMEK